MSPDFIVALKSNGGIVLDILEPHRDDTTDNWPKAVGMAKYAAARTPEISGES